MSAEQLERIQSVLGDAFRQLDAFDDGENLATEVSKIVSGNDRLTPLQQAEIYRGQFWLRHRDSLYEDYPGLLYILGEEAFERFLRDYLEACPPDSWTLRDLGNHIADFADTYDGFRPERATMARDMCRFELAFIDIWDGQNVEPIALERVQAIPADKWVTAKIVFHPLLTLLTLSHGVHDIRTKVRADEEPDLDEVKTEPTYVALWRGADERVHYRSISAPQHALVQSLRSGDTLGIACDSAAATTEDAAHLAGQLQSWFQGWAKRGWIVDVVVESGRVE